jgi:hypothetical protein
MVLNSGTTVKTWLPAKIFSPMGSAGKYLSDEEIGLKLCRHHHASSQVDSSPFESGNNRETLSLAGYSGYLPGRLSRKIRV